MSSITMHLSAYLVVALFTFGHAAKMPPTCRVAMGDVCDTSTALIAAALWPVWISELQENSDE